MALKKGDKIRVVRVRTEDRTLSRLVAREGIIGEVIEATASGYSIKFPDGVSDHYFFEEISRVQPTNIKWL